MWFSRAVGASLAVEIAHFCAWLLCRLTLIRVLASLITLLGHTSGPLPLFKLLRRFRPTFIVLPSLRVHTLVVSVLIVILTALPCIVVAVVMV